MRRGALPACAARARKPAAAAEWVATAKTSLFPSIARGVRHPQPGTVLQSACNSHAQVAGTPAGGHHGPGAIVEVEHLDHQNRSARPTAPNQRKQTPRPNTNQTLPRWERTVTLCQITNEGGLYEQHGSESKLASTTKKRAQGISTAQLPSNPAQKTKTRACVKWSNGVMAAAVPK